MRKIVFTAVAIFCAIMAKADPSEATFISDECALMKVFVDGKLINRQPKSSVQVKTKPGAHQVFIKVYDEFGCEEMTFTGSPKEFE